AQDLAEILRRYLERIAADGWAPPADLLRRAAGAPPSSAVLLVPAGNRVTPLERSFLEARFPERTVLADDEPAGVEPPANRWAAAGDPSPHRGAFLFAPADAPAGGPKVEVFRAVEEDVEAREVFRRILAEGLALDEVEVALADYDAYAPRLADVAAALDDVPVTFSRGLPGVRTAPVRVALGLADWMRSDFADRELRRLVVAGDLDLPEGLGARRAAAILREAGIGWGRDRYAPCLAAHAASLEARARETEDPERAERLRRRAEDARRLAAWCAEILSHVPAGTAPWARYAAGVARLLAKRVRLRGDDDAAAREALVRALRVPAGFSEKADPGRAAHRLGRIARGVRVGASPPKPGALHVCGLEEAGLSARRVLFVPGLTDDRIPGTAAEDPILRDSAGERAALGLGPSDTAAADRTWALARAFARARDRVVVSYPCLDPAENRPRFPSPAFLAAARVGHADPNLGYPDLDRVLGPTVGRVPRGPALTRREWWYRALEHRGLFADGREAALRAYPHLARGDEAARALASDLPGPHHGRLQPSPAFDPRVEPRPVLSASRLHTYARCPRRYFLEYVLRVEVPDEVTRDPEAWLDPAARGSLLHELYARFFEDPGDPPDPDAERERALEILRDLVAAYRAEIPPPSEPVFEAEVRALEDDVRAFLAFVGRHGTAPAFREAGFGMGDGEDALSPDPVELPAGAGTIRLRGQIDRIDPGPREGTFRVWDYKTGSPSDFQAPAEIARGTQLQHGLYAAAAEVLLTARLGRPARVEVSGYLFPTRRGGGQVVAHPREGWRKALEALPALLDAMAQGLFVATGRSCGWCAFERVCGADPARAWKRLREAEDPAVKRYREVEDHA
ncbi:MAG: PD-(D/E)XK nuclease family protein, partial [Candidatus Dadabacteria bacterium]